MGYFVLRQIKPPGRSALAHEATLVALLGAVASGGIQNGAYLEWSDPDADYGMGDERWTNDLANAKRFKTFVEAMECWKAQSTVRPLRSDGKPNRPLTAYSVSPEYVE
jgi:hypothetical protein